MANRFAVATGAWNSTNTWSATSGGAAGASVPGNGDSATLNNGAVVVTVTADVGTGVASLLASLNVSAGILKINDGISVYALGVQISGTGTIQPSTEDAEASLFFGQDGLRITTGTASITGWPTGNGTLAIGAITDVPAQGDVRFGTVYDFGQFTGSLIVPTVGQVQLGVAFDDNGASTGTLDNVYPVTGGDGGVLGG